MPKFSTRSKSRLSTCNPLLQIICMDAIEIIDFTVLCGYRTEAEQNKAYDEGKSKLKFPKSRHNHLPSLAIDLAPYFSEAPHIRWDDREAFAHLAGIIKGIAHKRGIPITWGGSWKKFPDYPHYQLEETE